METRPDAPRELFAQLKGLAIFAEVVRTGSMSAAARRLGMSASSVSQHVRALEQAHGVTLLHRSTRKLTLTEAGGPFAAYAQDMVDAAHRADQHLKLAREAPDGELRVSTPVGLVPYIAPALAPILADFPGLRLCLLADDAPIDLIDLRIDLAFRGGALPQTGHVARLIHSFAWVVCASPGYLARRGAPQIPSDLLAHDWIGHGEAWLDLAFEGPGGTRKDVHLDPRISCNIQIARQALCVAGLGLTRGFRADVDAALADGRLVAVLEDWRLEPAPLWAVTPQRDGQPAKVRHAIAAIEAHLRTLASSAA